MRKLFALTLVLALVLSMFPAAMAAETQAVQTVADAAVASLNERADGSDFYYELVEDYSKPDIEYRTELRWWMAEGGHTDETLLEELQAIYDAGFRSVELCQLNVSGMDATVWGYGSEQWNHDFHLVMNRALDLGMTVGITSGTNWATANVPGLNPDSQGALQSVFQTNEAVAGGAVLENHTVPTSVISSNGCGGSREKFLKEVNQWIGAYAYEILDADSDPVVIGNIIDVTANVTVNDDGVRVINWTAPEGANYRIFYYWMQGAHNSASPSSIPAYCINYFDHRGFEVWSEYFEANVLNDPALNEKIMKGNVQLFMDSLEYSTGDGYTVWMENFAEEFEARKGYDIRPYLVLELGMSDILRHGWPAPTVVGDYTLTDADLTYKIQNDLHDVQTKLYMENLLVPMEKWLEQYNIDLRAQISYGKYLEISEPSMAVDYIETESLVQRNQPEIYRLWTGSAKLQNKVMSSETGATFGMQYAYDLQRHMQEAYYLYAAGVSRLIWHVYTSSWAPTSVWASTGRNAQAWPGFMSMKTCNVFGQREPHYADYKEFNDHLGRVQQLLREGKARSDVAMAYIKYDQTMPYGLNEDCDMWLERHDYMLFPSVELQEHGYTYDYFNPALLNADEVYYDAENGTLELAGYKAVVLWQNWLDLEGAENLLAMAKQGLNIVIVDGAAVMTPHNDSDEKLAALIAEMETLDNVVRVATADDVMEALQSLGVEPYAAYTEQNQQLLTQVREDGGNRYLYVYNYCDGELHDDEHDMDHGTVADTEIAMDGLYIPYQINAWTGDVNQLAEYRYENGKTIIPIYLEQGDVALYAFEAMKAETDHIVATDAPYSYADADSVVVRMTESGTYETELAFGRKVTSTVKVPVAYDITDWNLTVESWTPGEAIYRTQEVNGVLNEEMTYDTLKTNIEGIKLNTLTTWDKIPEVGKNISGKGYYSATFNWTGEADGAYLDFGDILDSMEITINGQKTADMNMNTAVVDITDYLVVGENTIKLDYSSNLTNVQLSLGNIKVGDDQQKWAGSEYYIDYRAYGPAQAVIVPYVEESIEVLENNVVTIDVVGEETAVINSDASYDITVADAENLATATLTIETAGLTNAVVVPAEGWIVYAQTEENGVLNVVMGNTSGVNGDAVIATVTGGVNKVGTASVTLTEAVLSAYVSDSETFVNVVLKNVSVKTAVSYSIYDVNQDGKVDQLDITRAQRCYGKTAGDEGWNVLADVNKDGTVDINDLILILNNYTK